MFDNRQHTGTNGASRNALSVKPATLQDDTGQNHRHDMTACDAIDHGDQGNGSDISTSNGS